MRDVCDVPTQEALFEHNHDWLLHALKRLNIDQRAAMLMLLWRGWHIHSEITHDKKPPPVEASCRFLMCYMDSLVSIKQNPAADIEKGKQVVDTSLGFGKKKRPAEERPQAKQKWRPPDAGVLKMNTGGAFSPDGRAGPGMILRCADDTVVFAACQQVLACADALDAELAAMEEGLSLALHWSSGPIGIEVDSLEAINLVAEETPNLSRYAMRVSKIRESIKEREIVVTKVSREANHVSHCLAALGKVQERTEVWFQNYPPHIAEAILANCNTPA
ncbi:hypothetical protein ACQ4PT_063983 [Festuca glaucescens]